MTAIYQTTLRHIQEGTNGIYVTEIINVCDPARLLTSSQSPKRMLGLVQVWATPHCHPTDIFRC